MFRRWLISAVLAIALLGCSTSKGAEGGATTSTVATPEAEMAGADRDEHGCIPSAGFRWCEQTMECERPWELAKQEGFANSLEAFDA